MDNLRQREVSPRRGGNHLDVMSPVRVMSNDTSSMTVAVDHQDQQSPTNHNSCRRRCNRINAGSISNLCSATLGAGALSLPFAISLTGIIFGVLLLIFSAYLTVVSIDVIIEACVRTQLFKYEDVTVRIVGRRAGRVLEMSLLIFCFGTAVAYIVAVGDILDQGLRSIPYLWESDGFTSIYTRERIMVLFWGLVMFPLSLQRNVESLERFSSLGVLSIIFLVLAAVIHSIIHGEIIGKDNDTQQMLSSSMLWPNSSWDIMQAFPIIIFAFSCQVNVCAIYEELSPNVANIESRNENTSKQQIMAGITRKGVVLCMTLYICIGLFGYLDFGISTTDNILNNYCIQTTHDPLMTAASVFVAVAVVVAFPFNILPARVTLKLILERMRRQKRCGKCYRFFSTLTCFDCLWRWPGLHQAREEATTSSIDPNDTSATSSPTHADVTDPLLNSDRFGDRPNLVPHMSLEGIIEVEEEVFSTDSPPFEHFLLTLLLSGSALIVALIIPGISIIFGLMGGTAASIISFILPGLFLMDQREETDTNTTMMRRKHILPYLLVIGGTLVGVLSTWITLYGLFDTTKDAPSRTTCDS